MGTVSVCCCHCCAQNRHPFPKSLKSIESLKGFKGRFYVQFNIDGLMRGDYKSRMEGYAIARQNGWMSANDIRELENLDRIPAEAGGDLYLINGNMTKLEDAGQAYVE